MSDLGEISKELTAALDRLDHVFGSFHELDRSRLGQIQSEVGADPRLKKVSALIARARALVRRSQESTLAARRAGQAWITQHGSTSAGGSGSWAVEGVARAGSSASFDTPVAAAAWAERTPTRAGVAYFPATEPECRRAAAALPPFPREYALAAHGSSEGVFVNAARLGPADVAELIRADKGWGGRPVRLVACNTGRGERPFAAQLAELLGVPVTAPDDYAWLAADGRYGVAPVRTKIVNGAVVEVPDCGRAGGWRVFDPGRGEAVSGR